MSDLTKIEKDKRKSGDRSILSVEEQALCEDKKKTTNIGERSSLVDSRLNMVSKVQRCNSVSEERQKKESNGHVLG